MRRLAIAAVVVAVVRLGAQSPAPPQAGRGLIVGRVVEATSGQPVGGALVQISGQDEGQSLPATITNADGMFVFPALPAGAYTLVARHSGYSDGSPNQRRPDEPLWEPMRLAENERKGDITIRIWKHGAITGTVTDELGEPITGIPVQAFRRIFVAGRPRLGSSVGRGGTDDRGVYRISRVVAGDYVVVIPQSARSMPAALVDRMSELERAGDRQGLMEMYQLIGMSGASLSAPGSADSLRVAGTVVSVGEPPAIRMGDRLSVYPSQYFADTTTISAARTISVQSGQQAAGIDMTLRPVRAFQVSGRLVDDNGPVGRMPVRLLPGAGADFEMDMVSPSNATMTDDQGRFVLMSVTPGEYSLRVLQGPGGEIGFASAGGVSMTSAGGTVVSTSRMVFDIAPEKEAPTRFVNAPITVSDADIAGLTLTVRNGVRLSGRIEIVRNGGQPEAGVIEGSPIIEAQNGQVAGMDFEMTVTVAPNATFQSVQLPPGSYFLRPRSAPPGLTLESVMANGRDISDVPIEVTDKPVSNIVIRYTDRPAMLSGTVRIGSNGDRLEDAIVVAFPTDRTQWVDFGNQPRRLVSTPVSRDGAYSLSGLPPGDYFVAAVRDDMLNDWRNPAFLAAAVQAATRMTIGAGEQKTQGLTMSRVR